MHDALMNLTLKISPVDNLFFRDGRPFGPRDQVRSGLPTPQTLAGAIRTLILEHHGVDWDAIARGMRQHGSFERTLETMGTELSASGNVQIRGPWFRKAGEVLVPTPASLRRVKKEDKGVAEEATLVPLFPLRTPPPGWQPACAGMLPLWHRTRRALESPEPYIRIGGLAKFLRGGTPAESDFVGLDEIGSLQPRTGIGIDAERRTTVSGLIYSATLLSLAPDVSFHAEISGPEVALGFLADSGSTIMRFGGESRSVEVRIAEGITNWPSAPSGAASGRLLLLTTPAWFEGWKPEGLDLVAAAVGKPLPVSGWDLARGGPKPNRFLVPAGSVYFLQPESTVPRRLGRAEDSKIGWGHFLEGNWNYA